MIIVRRVVGHSMMPVLLPGMLVFGVRYFRKPKQGHVVMIYHDGKEKIKRIDQVKGDEIYVLGDHPQTSTDSRSFGWIPVACVKAKIFWPRTKFSNFS